MMGIKWRKQYDDPKDDEALGELTAIEFDPEEDLALQEYREDADINSLVRRFGVTGEIPVSPQEPLYGDFSDVVDYHTALNRVREAGERFERLPARVRSRFGSPGDLMEFVSDEKNADEARELGLLPKLPPEVDTPKPKSKPKAKEDPEGSAD